MAELVKINEQIVVSLNQVGNNIGVGNVAANSYASTILSKADELMKEYTKKGVKYKQKDKGPLNADCSSFVHDVIKQSGFKDAPHASAGLSDESIEKFPEHYEKVSRESAAPEDIVLMSSYINKNELGEKVTIRAHLGIFTTEVSNGNVWGIQIGNSGPKEGSWGFPNA